MHQQTINSNDELYSALVETTELKKEKDAAYGANLDITRENIEQLAQMQAEVQQSLAEMQSFRDNHNAILAAHQREFAADLAKKDKVIKALKAKLLAKTALPQTKYNRHASISS